MKRNYSLLIIALFISFTAAAQVNLKPSIGLVSKPKDTDSICKIQTYLGNFAASGLQVADTVYDFKLYNLNGDSLDLGLELAKGKPVLLVAGSYTCPVYRGKVPNINNIANTYAGKVSVFIIYIVEPHPVTPDKSPYSGNVWTTSQNYTDNVLYLQPKTYGERKTVVQDMLNKISHNAPVFIDGACNKWWDTYGPAPNNAYLIKPDGIVYAKHDWYDSKNPYDIVADINSLLNLLSVEEAGKATEVKVFPNPADGGNVNFLLKGNTGIAGLSIKNVLGEELQHHRFSGESTTIATAGMAKGIYLYSVTGEGKAPVSGKMIIR